MDRIIQEFGLENFDLDQILQGTKGSFLKLNKISADQFFSDGFQEKIFLSWNQATSYAVPPLRFQQIFPAIMEISDSEAATANLDINEALIQNTLRNAFRELGAAPIGRRGKDSALEVADLEHFWVKILGRTSTFSVVVKGYRSLGQKVNSESVMYQIVKAYRTRPDYILLLSAKEPVDSFQSDLFEYARSVWNPNLIIFVPPLDLSKFLIWRGVIRSK